MKGVQMWRALVGQSIGGKCNKLRGLSKPCVPGFFLASLCLGYKEALFFQVPGGHFSCKDFTACFRGGWQRGCPSCFWCFLNSYNLKYSACQVAISWGSISWTPSKGVQALCDACKFISSNRHFKLEDYRNLKNRCSWNNEEEVGKSRTKERLEG